MHARQAGTDPYSISGSFFPFNIDPYAIIAVMVWGRSLFLHGRSNEPTPVIKVCLYPVFGINHMSIGVWLLSSNQQAWSFIHTQCHTVLVSFIIGINIQ